MEPYNFKKAVISLKKDVKLMLNPEAHKFSVVSFIKLEIIIEKCQSWSCVILSNKIPV